MNSTNLRSGFTTGTCAQAAAKASAMMLINQKALDQIEVETPSGKILNLKLIDQRIGKNFAQCGVIKDSGDDPDVTNGVKIYVEVTFIDNQKEVRIAGGEGVGLVTKPGLPVEIGESAINPVPRKMISRELSQLLPPDKGFKATISVANGRELASRTFNSQLGILGGISIIGTTGIVEARSTKGYKTTLSLQLDMLKAARHESCALVLGYLGEKFCRNELKLSKDLIVKIGDHVGFMLEECAKKKISKVLLVGHIGKLVKVANGQFNTHIKFGDNRIKTIAAYAKTCGAKNEVIREIVKQSAAEATIEILQKNRLTSVFFKIAKDIVTKIKGLPTSCVILSLKGNALARYDL
jgi:cobalt-precorrin-5B (C1)-methyltransferase